MRLAIFETMNLGEGDHRLWFAIDELDALVQIDGLKDALARLRYSQCGKRRCSAAVRPETKRDG
jgi:type IV secretion system coupling TraD/TrwB family protein